MTILSRLREHRRLAIGVLVGAVATIAAAILWQRAATAGETLSVPVRRTTLSATLSASGALRPAQSITYRSPLGGRESQITSLVAEGTSVGEGDLLVRLDSTELQRELERVKQEQRQAEVDLQVAEVDRQESQASVDSLAAGEGALAVEEAKNRLQVAEKRADRLKEEAAALKPLVDKGFITKDEYRKTADELEQAEEDLAIARRRTGILVDQTHPQDRRRAELQLAQKDAQRENVRARLLEAQARVRLLTGQIQDCSIYAQRPGLAVYEEYLGASPRRKIRVGDRVTSSQGLVTIPEVARMLVDASVNEGDVHRLRPGLPAAVRLEAFPGLRLTGKVARVGTLATSVSDRPFDDKRFELIVELDPAKAELKPEMTARVDILLGVREGVLAVPVNAVFDRNGSPVCHVVHTFGVETRAVQVGDANETLVEVIAGLREGERVALTDAGAAADGATAPGTAKPAAAYGPDRGTHLDPR